MFFVRTYLPTANLETVSDPTGDNYYRFNDTHSLWTLATKVDFSCPGAKGMRTLRVPVTHR